MKYKVNKTATIEEKISIVKEIIEVCIMKNDLDIFLKEVMTTCVIARYYSDYELKTVKENDDIIFDYLASYDELISSGDYFNIINEINQNDLKITLRLIDDAIKEDLRRKSLSYVLLDKYENFDVEQLKKSINSIDMDKVNTIKGITDKL